ncbi:MAG: DHH family phosphoesterase [Acidobacteriia bacterium]|nr:DHH family phosphoesterase [Terriglobia bacterium]
MGVLVCFHDRCFDGACSAAVFTRLYHRCVDPRRDFRYRGLMHRAGQLFDESMFDAEENAIVDFKYSSSNRLTWWFDHHQSAFLTEADARHFYQDKSGKKFYGPDYRSCTKFIAETGKKHFGFEAPELDELVEWADLIDGARYPDTRTAVEMHQPATQLTLVIEGIRDRDFCVNLIPELLSKSLKEIMALPHIRSVFDQLYAQHLKTIEVIRACAELKDGVVFFDVSDQGFEGFNKFIPYYLFPAAVYSVALSRSQERIKIGVGSNPWSARPKMANLASICERYGGGGHAKVAAISLPPTDLTRAREVAREIVQELRGTLV